MALADEMGNRRTMREDRIFGPKDRMALLIMRKMLRSLLLAGLTGWLTALVVTLMDLVRPELSQAALVMFGTVAGVSWGLSRSLEKAWKG